MDTVSLLTVDPDNGVRYVRFGVILADSEGTKRGGRLGSEAQVLLRRYLPQFYAPEPSEETESPTQTSLLFRDRRDQSADIPLTQDLPKTVGCCLQAFLPAWAAITHNRFLLSVIRSGFTIHLNQPPPGGTLRSLPKAGTARFRANIATEIRALLDKQAIRRVQDHPLLCLSPVFVVTKRSGKFRMILNLKAINQFIQPMSFRMETLASILPLLGPGDFAVYIDLADAYHHVPIAASSQRLLGFAFAGRCYQYRALPFGLRPAPRLFTRLGSAVAVFLRQQGIRLFCYLDDWLILADSQERVRAHLAFTLQLVQGLGFLVNWENQLWIPPNFRPS